MIARQNNYGGLEFRTDGIPDAYHSPYENEIGMGNDDGQGERHYSLNPAHCLCAVELTHGLPSGLIRMAIIQGILAMILPPTTRRTRNQGSSGSSTSELRISCQIQMFNLRGTFSARAPHTSIPLLPCMPAIT